MQEDNMFQTRRCNEKEWPEDGLQPEDVIKDMQLQETVENCSNKHRAGHKDEQDGISILTKTTRSAGNSWANNLY